MGANIKVGLLLHFYQPWWQFENKLDEIVRECYRPIFEWVDSRDDFCFSANINWSLLELLNRYGHADIIKLMKRAVWSRRVELFGTAAHHPILPLVTKEEALRQIRLDETGKKSLGFPANTCSGFYLPEYAWKRDLVDVLWDSGYGFTVADDALYKELHDRVPFDSIPRVSGQSVFLRSREWGNKIAWGKHDFDRFAAEFLAGAYSWFGGRTGYIVLATDAETFGHHHKMMFEWLLKPMVEQWGKYGSPVEIMPFQHLKGTFGYEVEEKEVPPGSWSTELKDFMAGNYYPLWNSPKNVYHDALWKLVEIVRQYGGLPEAAEDVMKMLSSCSWWQVSGRPNFNPNLMILGADKALDVVMRFGTPKDKKRSEEAYRNLLALPGFGK